MVTRLTLRRILLMACIMLSIISCSKINQKHFSQVKTGMSLEQVTNILGEPTTAETIDISGLSGTSAVWKDDKVEIDIQFINGKASVKSFSKLEKE